MERNILGAALRIVEHLGETSEPTGVRELSRALGMSVGSTHRVLQALKRERMVVQVGKRGQYGSGTRIPELANRLIRAHDLVPAAHPVLRETAARTGESVLLMVTEAHEAVCAASVEGSKLLRVVFPTGWRGPLYQGASGRVLLAFQPQETIHAVIRAGMRCEPPRKLAHPERLLKTLTEIQRRGYAVSHSEREADCTSVAAAVRGPDDGVMASVALYGPSSRFSRSDVPRQLEAIRACAASISAKVKARRIFSSMA